VDDDVIEVYATNHAEQVLLRWAPLRMQTVRPVVDGVKRPNRSLADFVAPQGTQPDYIGLFAVLPAWGRQESGGVRGGARRLQRHHAEGPRRSPGRKPSPSGCISVCAPSCGATPPHEQLTNKELIAEKYRGIRPAPGYPACPDHGVKGGHVPRARARKRSAWRLTESLAMTPAASVSGFYLAHPQSTYFNVGRIGSDQLAAWGDGARLVGRSGAAALAVGDRRQAGRGGVEARVELGLAHEVGAKTLEQVGIDRARRGPETNRAGRGAPGLRSRRCIRPAGSPACRGRAPASRWCC
jgi:5-methyltetrahydrofolate--homocysteine methyltransferase